MLPLEASYQEASNELLTNIRWLFKAKIWQNVFWAWNTQIWQFKPRLQKMENLNKFWDHWKRLSKPLQTSPQTLLDDNFQLRYRIHSKICILWIGNPLHYPAQQHTAKLPFQLWAKSVDHTRSYNWNTCKRRVVFYQTDFGKIPCTLKNIRTLWYTYSRIFRNFISGLNEGRFQNFKCNVEHILCLRISRSSATKTFLEQDISMLQVSAGWYTLVRLILRGNQFRGF